MSELGVFEGVRIEGSNEGNGTGAVGGSNEVVAYFAAEVADAAVRRRVDLLSSNGFDIVTFTFRRDRFDNNFVPYWEDIELGRIGFRDYLWRPFGWLRALIRIRRGLKCRGRVDIFYARNLDMLVLAWLARGFRSCKPRLVYEVLDIPTVMVRSGFLSRLLRFCERRLMSRIDLLILSSDGFWENFYNPVQRYAGQWHLFENKMHASVLLPPRQRAGEAPRPCAQVLSGPWVIGWFGTLRCRTSLQILEILARAFRGDLQIRLYGDSYRLGEQTISDTLSRNSNITYHGRYKSPEDLPVLYGKVHFNWCVDLSAADYNSRWLLPNRLYEGGYFNVPVLALKSHHTGKYVERNGLGWSFDQPLEKSLRIFFEKLNWDTYRFMRERVSSSPTSAFVSEGELCRVFTSLNSKIST